ncbi:MAG: nucleotidyltransferase domain-containing protein [Candidatus Liptonbacteria bacterium]|nr:nucleotidyltransferase domain-containing protein [Candidatus Liptonbacteria bacterium]
MSSEREVQRVTAKILKIAKPISIFLYGSYARGEATTQSDVEIGVLMSRRQYISRNILQKSIRAKGFRIYPFEYETFKHGEIDTPFQKALYLRELARSGKTLAGRKIIERIVPPPITALDLVQRIRFDIGQALAAVLSYRHKDYAGAAEQFSKSCFFGARCLVILKTKEFPAGYREIYAHAKKLKLGKYRALLTAAHRARRSMKFKEKDLFANISFLNAFIEPQIVRVFKTKGETILIK